MKAKKVILTIASMALVAIIAVTATFAYLTSNDSVTNTFTTSAKVKITLDEAKVTDLGVQDGTSRVKANTYKLIPKHTYLKDPTVHVDADSEDCYIYAKIENGLGTEAAYTVDSDVWEKVTGITEEVYVCKAKKSKNDSVVVFPEFTFDADGSVTDLTNFNGKTIVVTAYAIQADGFATYSDSIAAAKAAFNWTASN